MLPINKTDFHIHTDYSYDSSIKSLDLISLAIRKGYKAIAITEHLDLLPIELGAFGLFSLRDYREHINKLQALYEGFELYCGVEVGDYHITKSLAEELLCLYHFDIVLGSVHFLSDHTNIAINTANPLDNKQTKDYYLQNLKLVSGCDIDILAHLGVFKRYYHSHVSDALFFPIIRDIFNVMIERKIALEINFSGFRKTCKELIPTREVLDLYFEMGGRLVSIGSDSHSIDHFDDHYDKLIEPLSKVEYDIFEPNKKPG